METNANPATTHEVVGIFMDVDNLHKAVGELQAAGFHRDELGLVASEYVVQQELGQLYCRVGESPDTAGNQEAAFLRKASSGDTVHGLSGGLYFVGGTAAMGALVASAALVGGPLVVALAAAVAVGAVGTLVGVVIAESDAEYLREQIDEGRMLLCVRLGGAGRDGDAKEILARNGALTVRTYDVPVQTG